MEDITENLISKCSFCYTYVNSDSIINQALASQNIVYEACCKYISKENLSKEFFKWRNSAPLPFCQKCLLCAQKLARMNTKIQELQENINKFVKTFTSNFLRKRTTNISRGSINDFKCDHESLPNSEYCEHQGCPFYYADNFASQENLLNDNNDNSADEGNLSDADKGEIEGVFVKKELEELEEYDSDQISSYYNIDNDKSDNEISDKKPDLATLEKKLRKKRNDKKLRKSRKSFKSKLQTSDRSESRWSTLPRRSAALKAVKLFSSFNDDLEMEEDLQSTISEESESNSKEKPRNGTKKRKKANDGGIGNLKCKYCKSLFSTAPELETHTSSHNKERPFSCDKCGFRFTTQQFLARHLAKHFDGKFFKCGHCENTYKYMHCLKDHVRIQQHHKDPETSDSECKLCESAISFGKELQLQRKIDDGILPSGSDDSKQIKKSKNGRMVTNEEISQEELDCSPGETGQQFAVKNGRKIRKFKDEFGGEKQPKKLYKCSECGKNCYSKRKLFYHSYSHKPAGTEINCDECQQVFTDVLTLEQHDLLAHPKCPKVPGESKNIQCAVCGKVFSSKGNLNKHMYLHSDVKQFPCPTCSKRFSTKSALTAHSVYHKKDRPYLCEECGQGFHTGTKLREHYRVHTGLLMYCEHCPKGFRNSTHLKQHLRVHNKGQQNDADLLKDTSETLLVETVALLSFQCSLCGQCFQNEIDIESHMNIHVDESKPIYEFEFINK